MDKNLINKIKNEKINYIVEWWEEDSLDIDSNQHILFSLENEDIDIIIILKNLWMLVEMYLFQNQTLIA